MQKILTILMSLVFLGCATNPVVKTSVSSNSSLENSLKLESNSVKSVTINLEGQVDDDMADNVTKQINVLKQDPSVDEIWIRIDSLGGKIFSGFKIIDAIERSSKTTVCVADHTAISMGFVILQACNKRLMTKRTVLMAHEVQNSASGNPHELIKSAVESMMYNRIMAEFICKRMQMPVEKYLKRIDNQEWWMDWEDALKYKAIDSVVEPEEIPNWNPQSQNVLKIFLNR